MCEKDTIPDKDYGLLFSQRKEIAREAEAWCVENNADPNVFNIVTALEALGYLKKK